MAGRSFSGGPSGPPECFRSRQCRVACLSNPRNDGAMPQDPFVREKFTRERSAATQLTAEYFERYPKDRYRTEVERRNLQSQNIEFTMKRLREPIEGAGNPLRRDEGGYPKRSKCSSPPSPAVALPSRQRVDRPEGDNCNHNRQSDSFLHSAPPGMRDKPRFGGGHHIFSGMPGLAIVRSSGSENRLAFRTNKNPAPMLGESWGVKAPKKTGASAR
jgi:hypothetical protein